MHDVINYLRPIVTRGPGSGIAGCYCVQDGSIYAWKIGLQGGVKWESSAAFNLPAEALDLVLSKMKEIQSIAIENNTVTFKSSRLKSSIKRDLTDPRPPPDLESNEWTACPALNNALKLAKPFIGNQSWQVAVRLMTGRVTAFNGSLGGIDIQVPDLILPSPILVTEPVIDFLIAQGDPDEMAVEDAAISFRYEDGRWLRAQFLDDEMPEGNIAKIFENAGEDAPVKIDASWPEAVADAVALSDTNIDLSITGLRVRRENTETEIDLTVDVGANHSSRWNAASLSAMVGIASAWNPAAYPYPALFVGEGFRGVIVGLRK